MKSLLLCASIVTLFCSCDPGHAISLVNNTGKAHNITYIESPKRAINKTDSLIKTDTLTTGEHKDIGWVSAHTDSVANTYTLVADPYTKIILERGTGRIFLKNLDQKVVIDGLDTIVLNKDKRVSLSNKFGFMSTEVVITVQ